MAKNNTGSSESQEETPAGPETPPADPAKPKNELQTRIEAAKEGKDLSAALKLIDDLYGEVTKTRGEAANGRTKFKELEGKYNELKKADDDRKLAEMGELERANTERDNYKAELDKERLERSQLQAELAFTTAGATDLASVKALWATLPEADRTKTTPEEWVKGIKESKKHLFEPTEPDPSSPNPRKEGAANPAGAGGGGIPHPQSRIESAKVLDTIRETYR